MSQKQPNNAILTREERYAAEKKGLETATGKPNPLNDIYTEFIIAQDAKSRADERRKAIGYKDSDAQIAYCANCVKQVEERERAKTISEVVTKVDSFLLTDQQVIAIVQRVGVTCKFPDQCKALVLCQVEAIKRGLVADHPEVLEELK